MSWMAFILDYGVRALFCSNFTDLESGLKGSSAKSILNIKSKSTYNSERSVLFILRLSPLRVFF